MGEMRHYLLNLIIFTSIILQLLSIDNAYCIHHDSIYQPEIFISKLNVLNKKEILLKTIDFTCIYESNLVIHEKYAIPSTQGWSRCLNCGLLDNQILLLQSTNVEYNKMKVIKYIDISWSLWGEFFHNKNNDKYKAMQKSKHNNIIKEPLLYQPKYIIDRPVYILPMITFHIGHILIDVLEQIYYSQMFHYNMIRLDSLFIFDVANQEERYILQKKLDVNVELLIDNDLTDSLAILLKLFTKLPMFSYELYQELNDNHNGMIIFSDLHIGLDIKNSFFHTGQAVQPCFLSINTMKRNKKSIDLMERYRRFQSFIMESNITSYLNPTTYVNNIDHTEYKDVIIGQRTKSRMILNLYDIESIIKKTSLSHQVIDFGYVPFTKQFEVLQHTKIFITISGTSVHNILFMKPNTIAIIIMPYMWCSYAWMYANQAILLGIKPMVYCTPSDLLFEKRILSTNHGLNKEITFNYFQWSRNFWLQGPRHSKGDNVTIDISTFEKLFRDALDQMHLNNHYHHNTNINNNNNAYSSSSDLISLDYPVCPSDITDKLPSLTYPIYHQDIDATNKQSHLYTSSSSNNKYKLNRILELYISSISVQQYDDGSATIGVVGEVGIRSDNFKMILESLPTLSICMSMILPTPQKEEDLGHYYHLPDDINTSSTTWCHQISALNYYSEIFLTFYDSVYRIHLWAQVSPTGGKLRYSDVYYNLDTKLAIAGSFQHNDLIGENILFEIDLYESCIPRDDQLTAKAKELPNIPIQMIRYPIMKFNITSYVSCKKHQRILFNHTMTHRLSFQRYSTDFCLYYQLTTINCADFISKLQRFLMHQSILKMNLLPLSQIIPTVQNPFIFFHIEKTAGTTIREYIFNASKTMKIKALIPCKTDPCMMFSLPHHDPNSTYIFNQSILLLDTMLGNSYKPLLDPQAVHEADVPETLLMRGPKRDMSNISIIAGHFDFNIFNSLPQCKVSHDPPINTSPLNIPSSNTATTNNNNNINQHNNNPIDSNNTSTSTNCMPQCLIIGRHPVDRAISYYYQRAITTDLAKNRSMNQLTTEELELIVLSVRVAENSILYPMKKFFIDDGMSDAACRMMIPERYTVGLSVGDIIIPPDIPEDKYHIALKNTKKCVIGMQEEWDETMRILDHWFPWIDYTDNPYYKAMKLFVNQETRYTLRSDLYEVLINLNRCDMILYEQMQVLFHNQLEVLKYNFF